MSNETEIKIIKEVYAAINRNDIAAAIPYFDAQAERVEPAGFPTSGTYRGHEELKAHLSQGRGTWAEGACEPEEIIFVNEKAVVLLAIHVRLKNKSGWIDAQIADVFTFRAGKIIKMESFANPQEAINSSANALPSDGSAGSNK